MLFKLPVFHTVIKTGNLNLLKKCIYSEDMVRPPSKLIIYKTDRIMYNLCIVYPTSFNHIFTYL